MYNVTNAMRASACASARRAEHICKQQYTIIRVMIDSAHLSTLQIIKAKDYVVE